MLIISWVIITFYTSLFVFGSSENMTGEQLATERTAQKVVKSLVIGTLLFLLAVSLKAHT